MPKHRNSTNSRRRHPVEIRARFPQAARLEKPAAASPSPADGNVTMPSELFDSDEERESFYAANPPAGIRPFVDALSPESIRKARSLSPADPIDGWVDIVDRLGLDEAVEAFADSFDIGLATINAFANLPVSERHELSQKFPLDICVIAGTAWGILSTEAPEIAGRVVDEFLAPEVAAAAEWWSEIAPAAWLNACGAEIQIH